MGLHSVLHPVVVLTCRYRTWVPSAVILVSFVSFTIIAKEPLTVSKAFTAIEVFSQLQTPMTQLPSQIFALLHGTRAFDSLSKRKRIVDDLCFKLGCPCSVLRHS